MGWIVRIIVGALGALVIWAVAAPFIATWLIIDKPLDRADAIMVLSGSSVYVERTNRAAQAYRAGISKTVVLTDDGGHSGWSQAEEKNPKFVELAERELVANGVTPEHIKIVDDDVTGTIYEARAIKRQIETNHWKSVLLVTSAYHTRRALNTVEHVVADENVKIGVASYPPGWQTPSPNSWWISREGWSMVAGEYLKSLIYWVYY